MTRGVSKSRVRADISFQEASQQLQAFLQKENRPHQIRWVFRDDLMMYKRNVFLRWPLPTDNEQQAEKLYYQGQAKRLGLALEILCFDRTTAYAYVLIPEDRAGAEALMMTALKFSYITDHRNVVKIKTNLLWQLLKMLLPENADFMRVDFVPLRIRPNIHSTGAHLTGRS